MMRPELHRALCGGALLITSTTRLAHDLRRQFDARQRESGHRAWLSPTILPFHAWIDRCWWNAALEGDPPLPLLTPAQESALWQSIIEQSTPGGIVPRETVAMLRDAWSLVHQYRIPLRGPAWEYQLDPAAFRQWARRYISECNRLQRTDAARWPDEAARLLGEGKLKAPGEIWIAGFDDLTPQQSELWQTLEVAGCLVTRLASDDREKGEARFALCTDTEAEFAAAARWARSYLEESPRTSIGIIIPTLQRHSKAIHRIFGETCGVAQASWLADWLAGRPEACPAGPELMTVSEAVGSEFDHLWIVGMHDAAWPPPPSANPFLPRSLLLDRQLPHTSASSQLAWARRVTARLLASSPDVIVSCPISEGEARLRPSPLFGDLPLAVLPAPPPAAKPVALESIEDHHAPALLPGSFHSGGTRVLQLQAACPFRAFAEVRLGAQQPDVPEIGLQPKEQGGLLHRALDQLWRTLRSREALLEATEDQINQAIHEAVIYAFADPRCAAATALQQRVHQIERQRLHQLLREWLEIEKQRAVSFEVFTSERKSTIELGGLRLQVRIDRIDRLASGECVLIDYKSSEQVTSAWEGDRPDDPQVPVYTVTLPEQPVAVAFGQFEPGKLRFVGHASADGLLVGAKRDDDYAARLAEWRTVLNTLAHQFREGNAMVNPKKGAATCRLCHLSSLCRIAERRRESSF